jgi:hypothetical protein
MNAPVPTDLQTRRRGAVTFRSVLLGLAGVVIICGFTPYNDYALNNPPFVGFNLPVGLMTMSLLFVVLINGPLSRWWPWLAFSGGEMAVAFSMALVSCCLPSSGLMRFLPGALIGPYRQALSRSDLRPMLQALHMPGWIFPGFHGQTLEERMNDPVITSFFDRWPDPATWPPYLAWAVPALSWGLFLAALFGAMFCLMAIVRRQWFENERLSFPLAQIQMSLIAAPPRGRWLNDTLRQRSLWIALGLILALRLWNGAAEYWPKYVPTIPTGYNFKSMAGDAPMSFTDPNFQKAEIFFTAIGVTFFLPSHVSFSLWFFYLLDQVYRMVMGSTTGDIGKAGDWDEHLGAVLAFALAMLWTGRRHWRLIIAQGLRGSRAGEPQGTYLPYPAAFWGLIAGTVGMTVWLSLAGASVIGAIVLVIMLLTLFMVITRIIAETGLIYGQLIVPLYRPWQLLSIYGWPKPVSLETFYLSGMLQTTHYDFREPMPVFASHAMKLNDQLGMPANDDREQRRAGVRIFAAMALALLVGYPVAFGSTLWTEYRYAETRDQAPVAPLNDWGTGGAPNRYLASPTAEYQRGNVRASYSPLGHAGAGFAIVVFLQAMRLRFIWWPLHPIGFLMLPTTPIDALWFSILIGWALKSLLLRLGGARLYQNAAPAFVGLILGECLSAGAWLLINLGLSLAGLPYRAVNLLPT